MLPKAEHGRDVVHLGAKLAAREALADIPAGATRIIAIATETAAAAVRARHLWRRVATGWSASPGAARISPPISAPRPTMTRPGRWTSPYPLARNLCLAGAAAARVLAIDTVFVDVRDEAGLRAEAEAARRDGFSAKMAIHPGQVQRHQ